MTRPSTLSLALMAGLAVAACSSASHDTGDAYPSAFPATPEQVLDDLELGNRRFVEGRMENHDLLARVAATASGQEPHAVVLGCLDSRVPPEYVFDQSIGDIFVGRVAGNFASTDMLGSFEFGTKLVGANLVVVLGHTECGAIKGACDNVQLGNLTHTLANLLPAVAAVQVDGERDSSNKAFVQAVAEENVRMTVARMTDDSPIMRELVDQGELLVVGAMYDVATGKVTFMDR